MSEKARRSQRIESVHEIEVARDNDHSTHEETMTALVVADSVRAAQIRAVELIEERHPEFIAEGCTALHCGSESMDDAELRQRLDDTQNDVEIGPEVPV